MVQSLHEISTKALMQRIADELEGLIVADAEGRYAYVNQRWSSLTGYTFEQVKGRYVRDVVRLSRVDEVLKTQKFVSGDAILLNSQTGEEVPVYCSYTPLFHENKLEGCLVYMIRKNEDVSMAVPSHVVSLLEELNRQMQLLQSLRGPAGEAGLENLRWQMAAASFWTRLIRCRLPCSRNSSGYCRSGRLSVWDLLPQSPLTRGLFHRQTRLLKSL